MSDRTTRISRMSGGIVGVTWRKPDAPKPTIEETEVDEVDDGPDEYIDDAAVERYYEDRYDCQSPGW